MMVFREPLQDAFLILDAVGIAIEAVVLTEPAVEGGFLLV